MVVSNVMGKFPTMHFGLADFGKVRDWCVGEEISVMRDPSEDKQR